MSNSIEKKLYLMVLFSLLLFFIAPVQTVLAGEGVVELITDPPGAAVYVDGQLKAKATPVKVRLPSGLRRFELRKSGYRKLDFSLFLSGGVTLSKSMFLIPAGVIESGEDGPVLDFLKIKAPIRDSFETDKEYNDRVVISKQYRLEKLHRFNRMAGNPIFSAGKVSLLKEKYDIGSGRFPVNFEPRKWSLKVLKFKKSFLFVNRNMARKLFSAGDEHPVYISFADNGNVKDAFVISGTEKLYLMGVGRFKQLLPDMGFVAIQGSCFTMGSVRGAKNEKPEHEVCVDPYWIGKYEVTQGEWMKIMGKNPSRFRRGKNHPVERVTWNDAQKFIKKLNAKGGVKYRLPTEAEWEYANQGGQGGLYPWGDKKPVCQRKVNNGAKFDDDRVCNDTGTNYVGRYAANLFALHDMAGNVREWVQDYYGSDYYKKSKGLKNPTGPAAGKFRVMRGGSWSEPGSKLRSTLRSFAGPDFKADNLGFRLVMSPQ
ncbi:MAG: SUMF1/EgtB/PvdO family nonheme iron enzyme [Magnetococcales bacterium]|nr:SUMF1/EgtB/PvdO family nonheme iron enzyme [Magnetococcales bacterium]